MICGVRARVEMSSGMSRRGGGGGGDRDRDRRGGGWRRDDYDDRRGGRRYDRWVAIIFEIALLMTCWEVRIFQMERFGCVLGKIKVL